MRRLLLVLVVFATGGCGSCFKSKPLPDEITQDLEDTGSGWMPKVYAPLRIPATPQRAEQWSKDPARHATYTSREDCTHREFNICNQTKYEYTATNDDGSRVYVSWGGLMSPFGTAEVRTQTELRVFDQVFVPELRSLIVEVARGPLKADGGAAELTRVPIGKLYDPYPAYKKAFDKLATEAQPDKSRALVTSYTGAFGPDDMRLAFDAYASPRFKDDRARRQLAQWLCGDVTERKTIVGGTLEVKNDARAYQLVYEKLFAKEDAPGPLSDILTTCFAGPVLKLDTAKAIAKRLIAMTCSATDEAIYWATDGARDTYRKRRGGSPPERELATFIKAEANACPEGPMKKRLLTELEWDSSPAATPGDAGADHDE